MKPAHLILTATLSLQVGCATVEPKLHAFPNLGLTVIRMDDRDLQRACAGVTHLDDGTPVSTTTKFDGCYAGDGVIYINAFNESIDILLHEMCHADGTRTPMQCKQEFDTQGHR